MVSKPRRKLTDTLIRKHKRATAGERDEIPDLDRPRLRLRVTDTGHKSFVYVARFPGSEHPTRRALGTYPTMTLSEARKKARQWDALLDQGIDPRDDKRRRDDEAAAAKKAIEMAKENTFAAVSVQYLRQVKKRRQIVEQQRIIDKELIPTWGARPVDTITPREVKLLVTAIVDRGKPAMARNTLTVIKSFFAWAADFHEFADPAAAIKPDRLIGEKRPRTRVLTDAELAAVWHATAKLGYPFGPLYRLLLLTGCRLREIAEARRSEIDGNILTVPQERFKSDIPHLVPLSGAAMTILADLPRWNAGDFIFSTDGRRPVTGFYLAKTRLDKLVAEELGEIPAPFVVHDLRRTVRTGLARLGVNDTVAEQVIGHGRKGIERVYDQHRYEPQMRSALELWANHLLRLTKNGEVERAVVGQRHA